MTLAVYLCEHDSKALVEFWIKLSEEISCSDSFSSEGGSWPLYVSVDIEFCVTGSWRVVESITTLEHL